MTFFNLLDVYKLSKEPGASILKKIVLNFFLSKFLSTKGHYLTSQFLSTKGHYLTPQRNNLIFITVTASCLALTFSKSCDNEPNFIRILSRFSLDLWIITLC
jgi:hypothetical protein